MLTKAVFCVGYAVGLVKFTVAALRGRKRPIAVGMLINPHHPGKTKEWPIYEDMK